MWYLVFTESFSRRLYHIVPKMDRNNKSLNQSIIYSLCWENINTSKYHCFDIKVGYDNALEHGIGTWLSVKYYFGLVMR